MSTGPTMYPKEPIFYGPWLVEKRKPRIVVMAHPHKSRVRQELEHMMPLLEKHAECLAVDQEFSYPFGKFGEELVLVLGGDGSILQAARQMARQQCPVLGVNLGRLGFLAAMSPEQWTESWPELCQRGFAITRHIMLEGEVYRQGELLVSQIGLNEAAILGGPPFAMLQIDLYVDGEIATTYSCDGLLVSTPIGSTAHNLSAGGPILLKNLEAFVISPINPHTLTMRPVVDSSERTFELVPQNSHAMTSMVIDGRVVCNLMPGDRVRVRRSHHDFMMVQVPGRNDYTALREKLGWSGSSRAHPSDDENEGSPH